MLIYISSMERQEQDCKQKSVFWFFFLKLKKHIKKEIIIGTRKYPWI